jgi:hypothetical protein
VWSICWRSPGSDGVERTRRRERIGQRGGEQSLEVAYGRKISAKATTIPLLTVSLNGNGDSCLAVATPEKWVGIASKLIDTWSVEPRLASTFTVTVAETGIVRSLGLSLTMK